MYLFSWIVVDKRTVLNENPERVHVRRTEKRGKEIDLIGQLNVAWLFGHSRGSPSLYADDLKYPFPNNCPILMLHIILNYKLHKISFQMAYVAVCMVGPLNSTKIGFGRSAVRFFDHFLLTLASLLECSTDFWLIFFYFQLIWATWFRMVWVLSPHI